MEQNREKKILGNVLLFFRLILFDNEKGHGQGIFGNKLSLRMKGQVEAELGIR